MHREWTVQMLPVPQLYPLGTAIPHRASSTPLRLQLSPHSLRKCWARSAFGSSTARAGGLRLSFLTLQGGNSPVCFILSPRASLRGWVPALRRRPLPNSTPCITFLPTRHLFLPTVSATLGHLIINHCPPDSWLRACFWANPN